jgi:asparagine synthase (glutamine-hydrolysing)
MRSELNEPCAEAPAAAAGSAARQPRDPAARSVIAGRVRLDPSRMAAAGAATVALRGASERAVDTGDVVVRVSGAEADLAVHAGLIVACDGRPRFGEARLDSLAAKQGAATAWAELLRARGAQGFGGVSGAYAVVCIDAGAGTVLAACDRFAVKPLCFAHADGHFAFATRADEVRAGGAAEIDPQAIYEYLYYHAIPTPRTVFQGVSRLCPANFVEAGTAGVRTAAYWTPRFEQRRTVGLETLEAEFRERVAAAVAREAQGRRTACFLSGGTDSSTVTGMLARHLGAAPVAYSIGFDAQGYDEMEYARIAARHFGADHRVYYVTPADLVESIPKVAAHYDQPFGNSSALPAFYCAQMGASDGFERLLAGDGGDELFGGNSRYAKQRVFEVYHRLPAGLRHGVIEPVMLRGGAIDRIPLVRKAASYVRQARLEMPERTETYNLLLRLGVRDVLTPAFLAQVDPSAPARQQREVYTATPAGLINAMLAFDWKYTLADNDLPKVCGTAALAGVDVAFPLLADDIVDLSLRLPASLKVRGLTLRYFFKRALRDFLPEAILRKRKHGFGLPFGPWLLTDRRLFETAAASVHELAARGLVSRPFVEQLLATRVREVPGYYGGMVWVLMMLEQWLRQRAPAFRVASA